MIGRRTQRGLPVIFLLCWTSGAAAAPPTGFHPEVQVSAPTRLDWEFAVSGYGPHSGKLPASYDSRKQLYQLFVPEDYNPARAWPLVLFISPGDDPLGWRYWQKPCQEGGMVFCAAYRAGNNCPVGQRARVVLDMLDDVRRHYHIDSNQTYLAGFSGGGRLACTLAFALPEYVGGVIAVCGAEMPQQLVYLRQRAQDRLSVALVTGPGDFNRAESESYLFPLLRELGIRTRLWTVPKLGHDVPGPEVLAEVHAWLADDRARRRQDSERRPGLVVAPDEVLTPLGTANRMLETARVELRRPERTWRAAALLEGILARYGTTEAGDKARKMLKELQSDPERGPLLAEQAGQEERQTMTARAQALERLGDPRAALQAWQALAKQHPATDEGRTADDAVRRLVATLAATPYLGLAFAGDTPKVARVVPQGPADRAGLKAGDLVLSLDGEKIAALADFRGTMRLRRPGDKMSVGIQRDGKTLMVTVLVGALSPAEPK
jgi:predicted esterase